MGFEIDPQEIEMLQAIRCLDNAFDNLIREDRAAARGDFYISRTDMDLWDARDNA